METRSGYALALAVCVAVGVAALSAAFWTAPDRTGLTTTELLRIESLDDPETPLSEQLIWTFDVLAGERVATQLDLDDRFGDTFGDAFTLELFEESMTSFFEDLGSATFVRTLSADPGRTVVALAAAETGEPLTVSIEVDEAGRFLLWSIDDFESGPRLPGWAMALTALTGWAALAASAALRRWGVRRTTWVLLGGSLAAFSAFLTLSDDPVLYTLGRIIPAVWLPIATWLLIEPHAARRRAAVIVATIGAAAAAVGVLLRNTEAIGHPALAWSIVDDEGALRVALTTAALLAAAAMAIVAWSHIDEMRAVGRWRRPPHVAAVAVASVWACAALFAAADLAADGGRAATGALLGVTMAAAAAVPFVVLFRHVTSRWDRPEIAGLVIDIGAGGTDLEHAVRRALDDESATVLASPDGVTLVGPDGHTVDRSASAAGRSLVLVRSDDEFVGAIEHDAALPMAAERVGAIAAAVGLALRVARLNARVQEQLVEVEASRARVIEASDEARRRVERDLHDGAQQRLVSLGMQLQRARRLAEHGRTGDVVTLLEDATAEARAAIEELRAVSRGAPPALLADRGLRAAVEALAERSPVPVDIVESEGDLPARVELTAYYVIAESMTNSAKHSNATSIGVSIMRNNGAAIVRVTDDGVGGAAPSHHSGLEGLQDRVAAVGGELDIESSHAGTIIEATLPCE